MTRHFRFKQLRNRRWGKDIALLMTGIGVGSGIALLLAPSTGEELRHTIGRGYHKAAADIGRRSGDLRGRAEELLEHAHLRELGASLLHLRRGEKAA